MNRNLPLPMKKPLKTGLCLVFLTLGHLLSAQNVTLSTNLLDWANVGTANAEVSIALSQHVSASAAVRFNPWDYGSVENCTAFQNKARTASLGVRYWPWTSFSSWWAGARMQVEEYNRGGWIFSTRQNGRRATEEGVAFGLGFSAGYQYMISKHLNIDLGLGLWGGRRIYTRYACPRCGRILSADDDGHQKVKDVKGWFLLPSADTQISLVYVF